LKEENLELAGATEEPDPHGAGSRVGRRQPGVVLLYWGIGREILVRQKESILQQLVAKLIWYRNLTLLDTEVAGPNSL